jgi:hypothetical protein
MKFGKNNTQGSIVQNIAERVSAQLSRGPVVAANVAGQIVALEGLDASVRSQLEHGFDELRTAVEAIAGDLGLVKTMTDAQYDAAALGGLMAGNYKTALAKKYEPISVSTESQRSVMPFGVADAMFERSFSMEAYDERENKNAMLYTITYNMQAARQDEFGETFFPTITITPDQVGFGVSVDLMTVFDGIERKISGAFEDFKRKNIIRAVADPSVLKREQTRVVPVVRAPQTDAYFVPAAVVPAQAILIEGESITTAPLKTGVKLDLLGISQTQELLAKGVMDNTDALDPAISLQNVYVTFTNGADTDVIRFNTINLPLAGFNYNPQSNYREMVLNFKSNSVLINGKTKRADGTDLVALAAVYNGTPGVGTDDFIVRLELQVTGSVNIETGETTVFGNLVSTYTVQDANGNLLDLTVAPAAAIAGVVNSGAIAGYDLSAYRTNMNRRQRGQLINTTRFTQLYNVPLRSPITAIHPINTDDAIEASDIQALVTATRIRTSNDAVTALINSAAVLREYVDARDFIGAGPEVMGVGRFFVRPVYYQDSIDMNTAIDSIKSHERAADIQAVLVNKIRDLAYRMYRDSEYKAAADALAGGIAPVPTVVIGTDPVLARYLTVTGDLRTLGGEFDVRIVSTLDNRVQGKIFISFGVFNEQRNTLVHPLNFGNMFWAPELVLTANISRGNTISKETVVQPRYLFVTHTPVMSVIEVDNVPDVLGKVAVAFHNV